MYGINDLKQCIFIADTHVECPVKDCAERVERQRQHFRREDVFKCPVHSIYISPSTFEYETEFDNMLWTDDADKDRFGQIKQVKRESRIARENSEDAVTWNVFRFLERNDLLSGYLSHLTGQDQGISELILWSYSPREDGTFDLLDRARVEFGELPNRGSEPDIIVLTDKTLFFIEAKVLAGNDTSGDGDTLQRHLTDPKRYVTGGGNWYSSVFKNDYPSVIVNQKYELMRFWLLGTWMAERLNMPFYLINLVMKEREINIEREFGRHILQNDARVFKRTYWENIYEYVINSGISNKETDTFKEYFKNKALGYNSDRELIKAFQIQ
jgi:hypothetical protein